jgi:transposase
MKPQRINKITGIPLRTVQDWAQKVDNDIDIRQYQKNSISQKISNKTRDDILNEAKQNPWQASTRKLATKYALSHTTVHSLLVEGGLLFKVPGNKHNLTKEEMKERVLYCQKMLRYKGNPIRKCFFSDEMGIRLSELHEAKKVWMIPGGNVEIIRISQDVKVNCWGAISWNGATSLHIFSENLTNKLYQSIVEEHLMEMEEAYKERDFLYQHDNLSAHNNLEVLEGHEKIEIIDFPTYSPDLNLIENVWAVFKSRIALD